VNRRLFVPTLVDRDNLNAQGNNARCILRGWDVPGWRVAVLAYNDPDRGIASNAQIEVTKLIFYPGVHPMDSAGLRWRKRLGLAAPVVVTLEGLLGNRQREAEYSSLAGHPVFCQHVSDATLNRVDEHYQQSAHVIAISPFLAQMGRSRFGDKFSVLPLGIDTTVYYAESRVRQARLKIVSAGGVKANKRPELFLDLARRYPQADFVWYGDGDMRSGMISQAARQGLANLSYPGALPPHLLGAAFRAADIFIMPSLSEGVPKVTQEAAACGLAQVIFGFYEAPSVINGKNGFVVWNDEAFKDKVGELLDNLPLVARFRKAGIEMAREWDWELVARQWRQRVAGLYGK